MEEDKMQSTCTWETKKDDEMHILAYNCRSTYSIYRPLVQV